MDPHDLLERVHDRESFFAFVHALASDREDAAAKEREAPSSPYGPDAGGWENTKIEDFLTRALAWAESDRGSKTDFPEEASWRAFATFLYVGKIYE